MQGIGVWDDGWGKIYFYRAPVHVILFPISPQLMNIHMEKKIVDLGGGLQGAPNTEMQYSLYGLGKRGK